MDAWVWATFRERFRPCGTDQPPDSDKMQCRCATLNPAHYARIKEEVLPTLKAADAGKGSLLNPSKVAAILARYGERTKTSAAARSRRLYGASGRRFWHTDHEA